MTYYFEYELKMKWFKSQSNLLSRYKLTLLSITYKASLNKTTGSNAWSAGA